MPSAHTESRSKMHSPSDSPPCLHSPGSSLAFEPFIQENPASRCSPAFRYKEPPDSRVPQYTANGSPS